MMPTTCHDDGCMMMEAVQSQVTWMDEKVNSNLRKICARSVQNLCQMTVGKMMRAR